jgi:hypothetical protein
VVALDGQRQVGGAGIAERLAVVERLEGGEFVDVLLDRVAGLMVSNVLPLAESTHFPPISICWSLTFGAWDLRAGAAAVAVAITESSCGELRKII